MFSSAIENTQFTVSSININVRKILKQGGVITKHLLLVVKIRGCWPSIKVTLGLNNLLIKTTKTLFAVST